MPGRKVWNVQEILQSADVNGYLMDQAVPRFTTTTQRDGQWPSPPDGALCVTLDTLRIWYRAGGVWGPLPGAVPRFASTTERDSLWPSPPDGAMCVTTDTLTTWTRRIGVWTPPPSTTVYAPGTVGAPASAITDVALVTIAVLGYRYRLRWTATVAVGGQAPTATVAVDAIRTVDGAVVGGGQVVAGPSNTYAFQVLMDGWDVTAAQVGSFKLRCNPSGNVWAIPRVTYQIIPY